MPGRMRGLLYRPVNINAYTGYAERQACRDPVRPT